jgi:hypothetical protein
MIKDSQLLLKPVKRKLKKKKTSLSHAGTVTKNQPTISNIQKGMDKR